MLIATLIELYTLLQDKENVTQLVTRGKAILERERYGKYRERFEGVDLEISNEITLINLYEVGSFYYTDDKQYLESSSGTYTLSEYARINYNLRSGDKAFFAVYVKDGLTYADFVEPYFENIDNLGLLK